MPITRRYGRSSTVSAEKIQHSHNRRDADDLPDGDRRRFVIAARLPHGLQGFHHMDCPYLAYSTFKCLLTHFAERQLSPGPNWRQAEDGGSDLFKSFSEFQGERFAPLVDF
jgi:hypothetical protein